ncbi:MAG: hypothetical protein AB7I37_12200 [Pirellulales bacterium]
MGAKNKLNAAALEGSLVVSGLLGLVTDSITVFVIALVGLLIAAAISGDVRR